MLSGILSSFSRLSVGNVQGSARAFTTNTLPLYFQATQSLWGEPLKKKRRIDPAVIRRRIERKKRNILKEIKKLQKIAKTLKPVLESQIPPEIYKEKNLRERKRPEISPEVAAVRTILLKKWSGYIHSRHQEDIDTLTRIEDSQDKALTALREESEELYQEAIQLDLACVPYKSNGPTITPGIEDYYSPDGDYINITKKYPGE